MTPPTNHREVLEFIKRISGQANFIGTPRVYIDMFDGDLVAAVWFNQVVYWDGKNKNPIGFYKTYSEWYEELGLTESQVRRVAKLCEQMGLVNIAFHKVYGTPKNHYLVIWDELLKRLSPNLHFPQGQESEPSETSGSEGKESSGSIEGKESSPSLSIEEITTKSDLMKEIRNKALSIFGHDFKAWRSIERVLEDDNIHITGTKSAMTISGLSQREGQFTRAEVFTERYGKTFSNLGLQITFTE